MWSRDSWCLLHGELPRAAFMHRCKIVRLIKGDIPLNVTDICYIGTTGSLTNFSSPISLGYFSRYAYRSTLVKIVEAFGRAVFRI